MTATLARAHRWAPPYKRTYGDIAADVGEQLGLNPDAEQRWFLDAMFAVKDDEDVPVAFEACVVAPRQNMKTVALEIAALTDLFAFKVPLHIWTAHEFDTSQKTFEDMVRRIEGNDDYRRRCRKPRTAHGDEAIELLTGERIEFHCRTGSAGRGVTGSRLTLDEWLYGRPKDIGALMPTLVTRQDAQVRYGSSAGFSASAMLRRLRDRGRAGGDPSLVYVEYAADRRPCFREDCEHGLDADGCALDDRELWWQANPALIAGRITEEGLVRQRRGMSPAEFMREFLTWWEDPEGETSVINPKVWVDAAVSDRGRLSPVAFGVTVTSDRSRTTIGVAGTRPDGLVQVEVPAEGRGVDWVVPWLVERVSRWDPCAVVLDGTAAPLIPALEAAGVDPVVTTSTERARATVGFYDAVNADRLRHTGDPLLATAVSVARKREMRDAWVWEGPGVGPLVAVTLARHGLVEHGKPRRTSQAPQVDVQPGTSETSFLATADF